jgi:hypothetical protein
MCQLQTANFPAEAKRIRKVFKVSLGQLIYILKYKIDFQKSLEVIKFRSQQTVCYILLEYILLF